MHVSHLQLATERSLTLFRHPLKCNFTELVLFFQHGPKSTFGNICQQDYFKMLSFCSALKQFNVLKLLFLYIVMSFCFLARLFFQIIILSSISTLSILLSVAAFVQKSLN